MIILYFNSKYFMWAPPLIESIAINEPSEKVTVFGLNLLSLQKKTIIKFDNVKRLVEMKKESFKTTKDPYRKNGEAALLLGKKAWYLRESFKAFPKEGLFILIDVDTLLLRPLMIFKRQMKNYDMAGAFGKRILADGTEKIKISGGFTAFRPTKPIKRLIKEWDEFLTKGPYYWNKDQPSLAMLYRKHVRSIRFLDIDRKKYMDATLSENSFLWSAHKTKYGSKNERRKAYLMKLRRMRGRKD